MIACRQCLSLRLYLAVDAQLRDDQENIADLLRKELALPQDDRKGTPGRNYQLQLYVAALCTNADISTRHQEPDIVCDIEGVVLGIPAKRPKTIETLEANVKDAAEQIGKVGIPGIIALDLTPAHNPTNRRVTSSLESQLYVHLSDAKYHDFFVSVRGHHC